MDAIPNSTKKTNVALAKTRFLHRMGGYYLQAQREGNAVPFFRAAWAQHCDRWPVDAKAFADLDFMKHHVECERKRFQKDVQTWAPLRVYTPEKHWSCVFGPGFEQYEPEPGSSALSPIDVDEPRLGRTENRKRPRSASDATKTTNLQPRPRPNPHHINVVTPADVERAKRDAKRRKEKKDALAAASKAAEHEDAE